MASVNNQVSEASCFVFLCIVVFNVNPVLAITFVLIAMSYVTRTPPGSLLFCEYFSPSESSLPVNVVVVSYSESCSWICCVREGGFLKCLFIIHGGMGAGPFSGSNMVTFVHTMNMAHQEPQEAILR